MHGLVMKITEQCIVILCEDGKFRNLPHPHAMPKLGDTIPIPDAEMTTKRANNWKRMHKYGLLAATLLVLFGITVLLKSIGIPTQPVALVTIDINPSFELFVDRKGKVEKAILVNDDAKWLMSEQQLKGKEFYAAVRLIINKAEERGYLDAQADKKWIWVSVVDYKRAHFEVDSKKIISGNQDYEIEMFNANEQQVEQAKQAGLTLNKYIVYEKAKQKGTELNVEELRTHSIASSLIRAGLNPKQFFGKASEKTDPSSDQKTEETFDNGSAQEAAPSDDTQKVIQLVQTENGSVLPKGQSNEHTEPTKPTVDQPEIKQRITKDDNENNPTGHMEQAQPKPDVHKIENPSSEQKKTGILEFELSVKLDKEQKVKLMYKNEKGHIEAKVEKETSQGKEQLLGEQALQYINDVIQKLALSEKIDKLAFADQVSSLLNFRKDQWIEMEVQIKFSNDKEMGFEIKKPLRDTEITPSEEKPDKEQENEENEENDDES